MKIIVYDDSDEIMITNKIQELNYFLGETRKINPNTNPMDILEELKELKSQYEEDNQEAD